MSGLLTFDGKTEMRGSRGEIKGAHRSDAPAPKLQTVVAITARDLVE